MSNLSEAHPSPHRDRVSLGALIFGASAAPSFWIAQLLLSSACSGVLCGSNTNKAATIGMLQSLFLAFDAVAVLAAVAGALVSYRCWRATHREHPGGTGHAVESGEGRSRFLALWGMLASIWFLFAIAFNAIASFVVPPCIG